MRFVSWTLLVVLGVIVFLTLILAIISLTQISILSKKVFSLTQDEEEIHGTLATAYQPNIMFLDHVLGFRLAGKPFVLDYGIVASPIDTPAGTVSFQTVFQQPPVVLCQANGPGRDTFRVSNVTKTSFDYDKTATGANPGVQNEFSWFAIGP